jgi:hypothetical protein
MCIICVEFAKGKLTRHEAWRNYVEMSEIIEPDHRPEVEEMLWSSAFDDSDFRDFVVLDREPYLDIPALPFIPDEEENLIEWYENHGQGD